MTINLQQPEYYAIDELKEKFEGLNKLIDKEGFGKNGTKFVIDFNEIVENSQKKFRRLFTQISTQIKKAERTVELLGKESSTKLLISKQTKRKESEALKKAFMNAFGLDSIPTSGNNSPLITNNNIYPSFTISLSKDCYADTELTCGKAIYNLLKELSSNKAKRIINSMFLFNKSIIALPGQRKESSSKIYKSLKTQFEKFNTSAPKPGDHMAPLRHILHQVQEIELGASPKDIIIDFQAAANSIDNLRISDSAKKKEIQAIRGAFNSGFRGSSRIEFSGSANEYPKIVVKFDPNNELPPFSYVCLGKAFENFKKGKVSFCAGKNYSKTEAAGLCKQMNDTVQDKINDFEKNVLSNLSPIE